MLVRSSFFVKPQLWLKVLSPPLAELSGLAVTGLHLSVRDLGDGHANQSSGHLKPGFRPEPKIVYIWGLNGPHRPPNPSKKVEGEALHPCGRVWKPIGYVFQTQNINDFRLRPKPWLQIARTLVSVAVAYLR